jgi:hypothetical protein
MIKIQIDNLQQKKQEYLDAILERISFRTSILHKSLLHLNGDAIDYSNGDLVSFRAITRDIISSVGDNFTIDNGQIGYTNGIANYLGNPNNLASINLQGLINFCREMLENSKARLSALLICEANELMNLNQEMLDNYVINTDSNIEIIKLAFDYQRFNNDISRFIRDYFRLNEFVKICPYCNQKQAFHELNDNNEAVESYQLDHFYDKATYPLMCYSLFNLVPSDYTCNVTNKGTTNFTDTYHINPHENGYDDKIKFIPIGITPSNEVLNIGVDILEHQGTALYSKINGNNPPNLEQTNLGNLNVFKIRSKYKKEKLKAGQVIELVKANDKNIRHIKKLLQSLNGLNRESTYIDWYKKKINGSFYPETFNDNSYSKFSRDIHDYYYSKNKTSFNRYIVDLIHH